MKSRMLKDKLGRDAAVLAKKKLWLFDLDGTIYNEETLFEGALLLLEKIVKSGGHYVFITNNSSKSLDDYIEKVAKLGIKADSNNFFTSTQATILYLKDKLPSSKIYCQCTKSMLKEMIESGINVTTDVESKIDAVVVGFDTEMTSEKIRKTCLALQRNIQFIATNCDLRCPVSFGFIPDCGSICQMITNATNRKPLFIGKPEPTMVEYVRDKFNCSKEETVVVGDRLYTDIATGNNAGVSTICVLTGETSMKDIDDGAVKPSFVFNSVADIHI